MAYSGSTAGSTAANPPVLLASALGGHVQFATTSTSTTVSGLQNGAMGAKVWLYHSNNDCGAAAAAAFFNDGYALGMVNGDVLIGVYSTADSTASFLYMGVLNTSAGSTSFAMSTLSMFKSTLNA